MAHSPILLITTTSESGMSGNFVNLLLFLLSNSQYIISVRLDHAALLYCYNGSAVCLGNGELFSLRLGPNGTNYNQLKDHPNRKQHSGLGGWVFVLGRREKYVVRATQSLAHNRVTNKVVTYQWIQRRKHKIASLPWAGFSWLVQYEF